MFTRGHTEVLSRTPAGIDQKMRVKTKLEFWGKSQTRRSHNSFREITGKSGPRQMGPNIVYRQLRKSNYLSIYY